MSELKRGDVVKHLTRGFTGTVEAVVAMPLLRTLDRKVIVRVHRIGAESVRRQCWESDLEILPAPAAQAAIPGNLPLIADEPAIVTEPPPFRRSVPPAQAQGGRQVGRFRVFDGDGIPR